MELFEALNRRTNWADEPDNLVLHAAGAPQVAHGAIAPCLMFAAHKSNVFSAGVSIRTATTPVSPGWPNFMLRANVGPGGPVGEWTSSIQCAHVRTMSDKTSPAGWVVQVTIPAQTATRGEHWIGPSVPDAPFFRYFNAAIAAAGKAIEAAKHLADPESRDAHVVRALSSGEVAALGLKDGEVKPA